MKPYQNQISWQTSQTMESRREKKRFAIVLEGNMHKFGQNDHLRSKLLKTGTRTIAEASTKDYIWGIGISFKYAVKGDKWRGMNLLGKVLMKVRKKLGKKRD